MSQKTKQKPDKGGATRVATIARKTKETEIKLRMDLDGSGQYQIETGIPFFDHMLESFTRHGLFDLELVHEVRPPWFRPSRQISRTSANVSRGSLSKPRAILRTRSLSTVRVRYSTGDFPSMRARRSAGKSVATRASSAARGSQSILLS